MNKQNKQTNRIVAVPNHAFVYQDDSNDIKETFFDKYLIEYKY